MKTIRLTMSQALIRFLENQYIAYDDKEHRFVKGVFMLPGHGNVVGFCQGLEQEMDNLEVYQGKNEQGQALAAMGYAKHKLRKEIFAVTSSVGPGAANMVTAAATATANNIPLLLLPGDVYASRQPDPVLQQIEQTGDLTISTNHAFQAVTKYFDRVMRPEQLMSAMINAMRVLTDQADTGAVCIGLPQDVQGEAFDYPETFFKKRVWHIDRVPASQRAIAEAVAAIKASKKPIIVCGGGVRYSEAGETLKAFAEKHNIPFGETQAGKSAVVWSHELNLGGIGTTGTMAANKIAADADVVIGIGTRYTDFTTSSKWLFRNVKQFININVSNFQALKMEAIPLVADAKACLEQLTVALGDYKASYTTEIAEVRKLWDAEMARLASTTYVDANTKLNIEDANRASVEKYIEDVGTKLTQTAVIAKINALCDKDASVVAAAGSLPACLQRMWRPDSTNTYHMEYGYSCMGYEIAAALGVKLAVGDDKEVICMVGDGSFHLMHSELITAVQERKKINFMLFDNSNYGCINNLQVGKGNEPRCTEMRYIKEGDANDGSHKGEFLNIDFAKVAEGYGCKSYKIYTLEDLEKAYEDAKSVKGMPVLFDIKVLPKTMTEGYDAWWRTGVAEVSNKPAVQAARADLDKHLKEVTLY